MSEAPGPREILSNLSPGERCKVEAIELPGSQKSRIMEMGLTLGVTVEFIRVAPMGDPIAIKVRGTQLSLRKADAAGILVTRI